jgi:hypothetical protein
MSQREPFYSIQTSESRSVLFEVSRRQRHQVGLNVNEKPKETMHSFFEFGYIRGGWHGR